MRLSLSLLLLIISTTTFATVSPVHVISTKTDIVYFKVNKSFNGAVIEIYSADGRLVASDTVIHHKTLVDFYFAEPGIYSIKITKSGHEEIITYEKHEALPVGEEPVENASILIR